MVVATRVAQSGPPQDCSSRLQSDASVALTNRYLAVLSSVKVNIFVMIDQTYQSISIIIAVLIITEVLGLKVVPPPKIIKKNIYIQWNPSMQTVLGPG